MIDENDAITKMRSVNETGEKRTQHAFLRALGYEYGTAQTQCEPGGGNEERNESRTVRTVP
jgi:hypothetical protein